MVGSWVPFWWASGGGQAFARGSPVTARLLSPLRAPNDSRHTAGRSVDVMQGSTHQIHREHLRFVSAPALMVVTVSPAAPLTGPRPVFPPESPCLLETRIYRDTSLAERSTFRSFSLIFFLHLSSHPSSDLGPLSHSSIYTKFRFTHSIELIPYYAKPSKKKEEKKEKNRISLMETL